MKRNSKYFIRFITLSLVFAFAMSLAAMPASAAVAYDTYTYDTYSTARVAPDGYQVTKVVSGVDIGVGSLTNPKDIFVRNDHIYILDSGYVRSDVAEAAAAEEASGEFADAVTEVVSDSGTDEQVTGEGPNSFRKGRIVVTDFDFNLIKVIDRFYSPDGSEYFLHDPNGFFVDTDEKHIYIADTNSETQYEYKADGSREEITVGNKVVCIDEEGKIVSEFTKPDSDIFRQDIKMKPTAVLKDGLGQIYILSEGFYYGAIVYREDGTFVGFYGANKVAVTAGLLVERAWRKIMTKKATSYTANYVPTAYNGFDVDNENFIYTISDNGANAIKKLNAVGDNVLQTETVRVGRNKAVFGDLEMSWDLGVSKETRFKDIDISDNGFINVIDYTRGRLFQYDQDGELLFIFSGLGDQSGTSSQPIAIESLPDESMLVLDMQKGYVTKWSPTEYGEMIHKATLLFNEGKYAEAKEIWQEVILRNSNFEMAYTGIGKAYYEEENYKEALKYLKLGFDRETYSQAYKYYRADLIRKNFVWVIVILVVVIVLLSQTGRFKRWFNRLRHKPDDYKDIFSPFYIARHPIDGFEDLRFQWRNRQIYYSIGILFLFFISRVIERQSTGFILNTNKPEDLNIGMVLLQTVVIALLFIASNWAVTTFTNGEGSLRKIFYGTCYSLLPYSVSIIIKAIASNFITYDETALLNVITYIGTLWSVWLLMNMVKGVHQFRMAGSVLTIVFTVVFMIVVAVLVALSISLIQQFYVFLLSVYNEIAYRIS
ncbi:MAG: YIP1 family protein [Clostridia bacterium]|nr:YIP1 family protein [Clostridia bacterium]